MSNVGEVLAVRGNVVDVRFAGTLPPRRQALCAGDNGDIVLEIERHTSTNVARCIDLTRTRGWI